MNNIYFIIKNLRTQSMGGGELAPSKHTLLLYINNLTILRLNPISIAK